MRRQLPTLYEVFQFAMSSSFCCASRSALSAAIFDGDLPLLVGSCFRLDAELESARTWSFLRHARG